MTLLVLLLSYVLGSLSPSRTIARRFSQKDLHRLGSGNYGALNTYRNFGTAAGMLVLLLDAAKGALAAYLAVILEVNPLWALAGVVGGHNFSIFLKFQGGKGLAAALGALLVIDYRYAAVLAGTGLLFLLATRNKYLAAVALAGAFPLVLLYFDPAPVSVLLGLWVSLMVIIKHRKNFSK